MHMHVHPLQLPDYYNDLHEEVAHCMDILNKIVYSSFIAYFVFVLLLCILQLLCCVLSLLY